MRVNAVLRSQLPGILNESWVDNTRRPYISGSLAYIPVRDGFPCTETIPERRRKGRGFQRIGDIILFHGTFPTDKEISEIINLYQPRGILHLSSHKGICRIPEIQLIYGEAGQVIHHESDIKYYLDPTKVMFSQGNREEKRRISNQIIPDEKVCDMFAGIGYFSLPMAKAGAFVRSCEINPVSYQFLLEGIRLNKFGEKITPILGDCREHLHGVYDRIHMGHFEAISFLHSALSHTRAGTYIHLHCLEDLERNINKILQDTGYKADIELHRVKKAGPRIWHQVYDLEIL